MAANLDGFDSQATPNEPMEPQEYRFRFDGSGSEYFFIFLKHIFLTLVTLGLYFAWAKTERRAFIWKSLSFHDHPFRYTGTGIELFKGYAIVFGAYILLTILIGVASAVSDNLAIAVQIAFVIAVLFATPYVIYRSRNFLYNRTTWRGIRFGLEPGAQAFATEFFRGFLLTLITFGIYGPVYQNKLHRVMMNRSRFGSLELRYDGDDKEVWFLAVKGFFLGIVTFGIYFFWYRAALERYRADHTYVGETAKLHSEIQGTDLFILYVLNIFGLTLTLGLAFPWILMYSMSDIATKFSVRGQIDFDEVAQRAEEEGALSEGLADALDLDLGF